MKWKARRRSAEDTRPQPSIPVYVLTGTQVQVSEQQRPLLLFFSLVDSQG